MRRVHFDGYDYEIEEGYCFLETVEALVKALHNKELTLPMGVRIVRGDTTTSDTPTHDPVNHPKHYTNHPAGIECIQVVEHYNFNVGNAIKYLWRADEGKGDPIENLRKAAWYVNREIQRRTAPRPKAKPVHNLTGAEPEQDNADRRSSGGGGGTPGPSVRGSIGEVTRGHGDRSRTATEQRLHDQRPLDSAAGQQAGDVLPPQEGAGRGAPFPRRWSD